MFGEGSFLPLDNQDNQFSSTGGNPPRMLTGNQDHGTKWTHCKSDASMAKMMMFNKVDERREKRSTVPEVDRQSTGN